MLTSRSCFRVYLAVQTTKRSSGVKRHSKATRAAVGGIFGGGLAALTGSTPIGVALVAVLGAGLAVKAGLRQRRED